MMMMIVGMRMYDEDAGAYNDENGDDDVCC